MDSKMYWQLFWETGAPEMYMLYNQAKKTEETNVLDNTRFGAEDYKLQ